MAEAESESLRKALLLAAVQLTVGMLLVLRSTVLACLGLPSLAVLCERFRSSKAREDVFEGEDSAGESEDSELSEESFVKVRAQALHGNLSSTGITQEDKSVLASVVREEKQHTEWQRSRRMAFEQDLSIFCSHVRSEAQKAGGFHRGYLGLDHFFDILCLSLGWAIISGGIGSWVCWVHSRGSEDLKSWVEISASHLSALMSDFKWLPIFMLSAHLAFFVQRWRQFIFAAWGVEGRFKDLGIVIGADVVDPSDPESRRLMFRCYRYMVLAMALQYKTVIPQLKAASAANALPLKLQTLGLLTEAEECVLTPAGSRMRDTVLSWIALEVNCNSSCQEKGGLLRGTNTLAVMDKLTALRAKMMFFHGNSFYPQPNLSSALMKMLVDIYCLLMVVSYPFKMLTPLPYTRVVGLQPLTILSTFLMTVCFWGAESLACALATPFASRIDTFNIDALIAGTEQTLFASLRASFDNAARTEGGGCDMRMEPILRKRLTATIH